MKKKFKDILLESTGSTQLKREETIQNLWSGYGKIERYKLSGGKLGSVIVKHVCPPTAGSHPRGWNTDNSHQRKLKSYKVETAWYSKLSKKCSDLCRVPTCFAVVSDGNEVIMVLEDLDASGFPLRKTQVGWDEIKAVLKWLANFHSTFLGVKPSNLWETGTYWHLQTRPDELKIMQDLELKQNAHAIDKILQNNEYQTLVHGDAKLANFCFSIDGKSVAAVDFQYIGGGCGMKDVAYFIGSCLNEEECERLEEQLLAFYFKELRKAISLNNKNINPDKLEASWREMYPYAWTDFHRFLKGWSPDHWKINSYSERIAREIVSRINGE